MERVTFAIRWDEEEPCQLVYIVDNGVVKATTVQSRKGLLVVRYDVEAAASHQLEWSLLFLRETRSNLEAIYQRDGGDRRSLARVTTALNHWSSGGAA
ncbi:MAG TPA: hypothetical protein VIG99_27775 [Myxococcaceae bacterium]|jgi:hypothetical protein